MKTSAAFRVEGDALHIPSWEWTCPLSPIGRAVDVDADLFGETIRARRGYEWMRVENGELITGPPMGVALGFENGWWIVMHFGGQDAMEVIPNCSAMESGADGSPCMWIKRADCRDDVDADALLRFVRDVMARDLTSAIAATLAGGDG